MRSAKGDAWKGAFSENIGYFGKTLRDASHTERAVIFIAYDKRPHKDKLSGEIQSLYFRLLCALVVACIINYIIGYQNTRSIMNSLSVMERSIGFVGNEGVDKIDLKELDPPLLAQNFRKTVNRIIKILQLVTSIEKIISTSSQGDSDNV